MTAKTLKAGKPTEQAKTPASLLGRMNFERTTEEKTTIYQKNWGRPTVSVSCWRWGGDKTNQRAKAKAANNLIFAHESRQSA